MNEQQALEKMVSPGMKRRGAFLNGIIQIHLTRACDLACSNCTQMSQFGGKPSFITLENFTQAVISLKDYFGVVGIFGGNPALHPQFEDICRILSTHIPKNRRGLWCNNPRGHGKLMSRTFNPAFSNLNVHLSQEAWDEFKRDWPGAMPFGLTKDSRHAPVYGNLERLVPEESRRWDLIGNCAINQNWSAMICQFRGELRGFFCEIAGAQAMINQNNPDFPDTGLPVEPGWWKQTMPAFAGQVRTHCHRCIVPLDGHGSLAQQEHVTHTTDDVLLPRLKGTSAKLQILNTLDEAVPMNHRVTEYVNP